MAAVATPPPSSGSVAPPSAGEIHVTPSGPGAEGNPTVGQPKPGSVKAEVFKSLREKVGAPPAPTTPAAKPKGQAAAPDPAAPRPGANQPPNPSAPEPETPEPGEGTATPPAEPPKPGETPKPEAAGKKPSPWKLVDEYKARATQAETRALELEKAGVTEAKRKEYEAKITAHEARIKEMEDDLRFFNADKYDPEISKANTEYQGAWNRAMKELSEIPVIDGATGTQREMTAQDLLDLVNMPLGKAREVADSAFGVFAGDVMAHRKQIKDLFENKTAKLEELKKTGGEREKQRKEQYERLNGEISNQIKTTWETEHAAVLANEKHGKFFKPREGDQDWNTRIERGFKFVDEALSANPTDPRMTPEQRALTVKKQLAIRNRAAAFDAIRLDYERTASKLAEVQKKLDAYEASTPGVSGTVPAGSAPSTGSAKESMFAALRKVAR